jgi:hypothetical protein
MSLARPVATLACNTFATMLHLQLRVSIGLEALPFRGVTGEAGFRSDKVRWIAIYARNERWILQMRMLKSLSVCVQMRNAKEYSRYRYASKPTSHQTAPQTADRQPLST